MAAQNRNGGWAHVWQQENREFSIPVGQWINMKLYLKEGDREHGRFCLGVQTEEGKKTTVFDITDSPTIRKTPILTVSGILTC